MNAAIMGTQWGDEGKGKIVNLLTPYFDLVARGEGGHNAGHTVIYNGKPLALHLIPSGITEPDAISVIGRGTLVDARAFAKEVLELNALGIQTSGKLFVSERATLITPKHNAIEAADNRNGVGGIGTTMRGIGPAQADRRARFALLVGDILRPNFEEKLRASLECTPEIPGSEIEKLTKEYLRAAQFLMAFIADTDEIVWSHIKDRKHILLEGAQAHHLGIYSGTYPNVTSSACTIAGLCEGVPLAPRYLDFAFGVAKAYTTRVGGGSFATELFDETGEHLQKIGNEVGASTGRKRRCGWLDAVVVRDAVQGNGLDELIITKIDVLSGLPKVKLCTHYELDGNKQFRVPADSTTYERCIPVYTELDGWTADLSRMRKEDELPPEVWRYVEAVEDTTGCLVGVISVGPAPQQTIILSSALMNSALRPKQPKI